MVVSCTSGCVMEQFNIHQGSLSWICFSRIPLKNGLQVVFCTSLWVVIQSSLHQGTSGYVFVQSPIRMGPNLLQLSPGIILDIFLSDPRQNGLMVASCMLGSVMEQSIIHQGSCWMYFSPSPAKNGLIVASFTSALVVIQSSIHQGSCWVYFYPIPTKMVQWLHLVHLDGL